MPVTTCALFRVNYLSKRASEIRLNKDVTNFGYFATRKKDSLGIRPLREDRCASFDVFDSQFVDRKTIGEFNRGLHHLSESLGPEIVESGYAGIEYRRNGGGKRPG